MSFDLFLHCFVDGENSKFPLAIVEDIFGPFVDHKEPKCWVLAYPKPLRSLYRRRADDR